MKLIESPIIIEIPIEAVPKGRPRFNTKTGRSYTPPKTAMFENSMKMLLRKAYQGKPLTGPLSVIIDIHLKRAKSNKDLWPSGNRSGDCDNYAKGICDASNEILWVDDCQICSMLVRKVWADGSEPRIMMVIDRL